jgi:hypothetical protein
MCVIRTGNIQMSLNIFLLRHPKHIVNRFFIFLKILTVVYLCILPVWA